MRTVVAPWFAASPKFLRLGADGEYLHSLLAQSGRCPWPGWHSGCDQWSPRSLQPFCASGLLLSDVRIRAGLARASGREKTIAAQIDEHGEQIGGQIVTCPVLVPAWP